MVVEYKCNKCTKIFRNKYDYKRHCNIKRDCTKNINKFTPLKTHIEYKIIKDKSPVNFMDDRTSYIDSFNHDEINEIKKPIIILDNLKTTPILINDNLNQYNNTILIDKNSNDLDKTPKLNSNPPEINKMKKITCEYCVKKFTRSDSLNRHLNGRCKEKIKLTEDQKIIKKLLEEMNKNQIEINEKQNILLKEMKLIKNENGKLKNKINHLVSKGDIINSNNTTQNNLLINNINIVAFGKEKLDEIIGEDECKKILFRGFEARPTINRKYTF